MDAAAIERGKQIVDEIRISNGGTTAEDREKTPLSVLRSLESTRKKLGKATQTLAHQLYSKETRFVFELIQNAEDNVYTNAVTTGQEPYLSFTLNPTTIMIDSNEDGFTEKDVEAICSTGESKKKDVPGYVGEKGIGFKSVFKVSSIVHIQSGMFSFSFNDTIDGGLGMITPEYREHEQLPAGVVTRIILQVHPSKFSQHWQDFQELPDTLLLFLRRLKQISVRINRPTGEATSTKLSYQYNANDSVGVLTKRTATSSNVPSEKRQHYYIKKHTMHGLPFDKARESTRQAEVVLAFPMDSHFNPIVESQHVFAYLPVRKVGFNFLIQSDFITQASREDVFHSPRNEAILHGIAQLFCDSIVQFCSLPALKYRWTKYLPGPHVSDVFWSKLRNQIYAILAQTPVLYTRERGTLKRPGDVRQVRPSFLDQHGNPLFRDLDDEIYLAQQYAWTEVKQLEVKRMSWSEIIQRIRADASRDSQRSLLKSTASNSDWHRRVAQLLLGAFDEALPSLQMALRETRLVPLVNGEWVPGQGRNPLFPENGGVRIPRDLGLDLVKPEAIVEPSRYSLFEKLGVQICAPQVAMKMIYNRYKRPNDISLQSSVDHLRYLFWHLRNVEEQLDRTIPVKDRGGVTVYRAFVPIGNPIGFNIIDDVYFESSDEYSCQQLTQKITTHGSEIAPGYYVRLLHPAYMNAVQSDVRRSNISWRTWLEKSVEIKTLPVLRSPSSSSKISAVFNYITIHRPQMLVGLLKKGWHFYEHELTNEVIQHLANANIPCESSKMSKLRDTFLPMPVLKEKAEHWAVSGSIPFLSLNITHIESLRVEWGFLQTFGVHHQYSIYFVRLCLQHFALLSNSNTLPFTLDTGTRLDRENLLGIYEALTINSKGGDHETTRSRFSSLNAIYLNTSFPAGLSCWHAPEACVWQAPSFLTIKPVLASCAEYSRNSNVETLFRHILQVRNADWRDYVDELQELRRGLDHNVSLIHQIYEHLERDVPNDEWNDLRSVFESSQLIYSARENKWHPPTVCLWAHETQLTDRVPVSSDYSGLTKFFLERLRVEKPDLKMHVTDLERIARSSSKPPIEKFKDLITAINDLTPNSEDVTQLMNVEVLPVRHTDGRLSLESPGATFSIVDRADYGRRFARSVPVLDFDFAQSQRLERFIGALSLMGRYMSRSVSEITSAIEGVRHIGMTNKLRQKAFAIVRCASHRRDENFPCDVLNREFLQSEVRASSDIKKELRLSINSETFVAESTRADLHIERTNSSFKIFVPDDRKSQILVWTSSMAGALMSQLSVHHQQAREALLKIMATESDSDLLEQILESEGIPCLAGIEPAKSSDLIREQEGVGFTPSSTVPTSPADEPTTPVREQAHRPESRGPIFGSGGTFALGESSFMFPDLLSPNRGISTPRTTSRSSRASSPRLEKHSRVPSEARSEDTTFPIDILLESHTPQLGGQHATQATPPRPMERQDAYVRLLDRVIQRAGRDCLPFWMYDFQDMLTALPADPRENANSSESSLAMFADRSEGLLKRDIKVGAAGELFVFETLLSFSLPGFSRDNWKSNVRKEVCVHSHYRTLKPWDGTEKADIVFEDIQGELTKLLIDRGFLDPAIWREARPKYLIEVKTTTLRSNTRFFMSKAQFDRMQNLTFPRPDQPECTIYLIARVFNLGRSDMRMQIYVDPEQARRTGRLCFTPDSYSVVPRGNAFEVSGSTTVSN